MEFLPTEIDDYSRSFTDPESELLKKINRDTYAEVMMPRMLSGHMQGRILSMFSKMIRPQAILEIGTYTGYSALCMAEGLQKGGKLVTIDVNAELESRVRGYFSSSEYKENIEYIIGDARNIIPGRTEKFDIVFIDADKENYANYFDLVQDRLSPNAWIIADNVLWSGKILSPEEKMDKDTLAIHRFNQKVMRDERYEKVMFPVRDGLYIARRKG